MSVFHRKPRVFVSGVTQELKAYRDFTDRWLSKNGYTPVTMDDFGTQPNSVDIQDTILKKLLSCQAIVCLIGDGYGYDRQNAESRQSYTQYEYHTAKQLGLTIYAFITKPGMEKGKLDEPHELS